MFSGIFCPNCKAVWNVWRPEGYLINTNQEKNNLKAHKMIANNKTTLNVACFWLKLNRVPITCMASLFFSEHPRYRSILFYHRNCISFSSIERQLESTASQTFRQVRLQSNNIWRYCCTGVLHTSHSIEVHLSPMQIAIIVYKNLPITLLYHQNKSFSMPTSPMKFESIF